MCWYTVKKLLIHSLGKHQTYVYATQSKARNKIGIACDYFVDALDAPDFAVKVRERARENLDDALHTAL